MNSHMQRFRETPAHALNIGTLPFLSQYGFTSLLHHFTNQYPKIPLSIHEAEESELLSGLLSGLFDFILARETMLDQTCTEFFPIAKDRLLAALF
ncbi:MULTISPECIES: LysR substrate-binding domain-containing protein [Blautia]|uniref:LysR substrate-binding domain-containing protein n=2 Tax=Blautia argi TaxID=1912897 RepID=A0A2Z4UBN9_9FIRM|nr:MULTISPECIES: LysR substrate-binding domain-containing protein [Blautia]AWY98254.1 hypothetical protein DQQ01_08950 [Blautia argi]